MKELADVALNQAQSGGASYADIRLSRHKNQSVSTREQRVQSVSNQESFGFGVRVLVNGTWGFAASHIVDKETIAEVTNRAVAIAKANQVAQNRPVTLPPVKATQAKWDSPIKKDPFDVPIREKVDLLLNANAEALKVDGARFVNSRMLFLNEQKTFASTDGSYIEQNLYRSWPSLSVTAINPDGGGFESRDLEVYPMGAGYEFVEETDLVGQAQKTAEEAVMKLSAKSVEPGKKTLILAPSHLWLTIHESVGHSTELDRALGYEANYAGTSFLTLDKLGKLKFGSDIVNFKADKTIEGGLATCGYDDDGVQTGDWYLVRDGLFIDYQTIREQVMWPEYRQARKNAGLPEVNESYGCSYGDSWSSIPFQRMPNIHLDAAKEPRSLDDLISGTDDGIYITGRGSYSIDQQRYNFQFGGQTAWEIKHGKITGMLKDVAYQANTQDFWNACDAIGDESTWEMGGSYYDGKGQPGQINAVSHGCPPSRFQGINILNTGRTI